MQEQLTKYGLTSFADEIAKAILPAIGFYFASQSEQTKEPSSKLGGKPWLPNDFEWPKRRNRPLDFLLQIQLSDTVKFSGAQLLPQTGLLSFFYDMEDQPWGFDPKDLDGFRVYYFPETEKLISWDCPDSDYSLGELKINYYDMKTLPHFGSRAAERLEQALNLKEDQWDAYYDFAEEFERSFRPIQEAGNHHLLGHSYNIQGDMQLEAQLVTNGLYCGDPSGYNDPKAKELEPGADDWLLLLQFDSDDTIDLMWGDVGMLYFWIRKQDLAQRRFNNAWIYLQCH